MGSEDTATVGITRHCTGLILVTLKAVYESQNVFHQRSLSGRESLARSSMTLRWVLDVLCLVGLYEDDTLGRSDSFKHTPSPRALLRKCGSVDVHTA